MRTSWLCGAHGTNMVRTALRLADGEGELRFVDDQHGSPTFTADLAPAVVTLGLDRRPGIFHVTNSGATTWWGFVRAVLAEAGADPERVLPIKTQPSSTRPCLAPRPAYSVLDNMALRLSGLPALPDWQDGLARLVPALRAAAGRRMSIDHDEPTHTVAVIGAGYVGLPTAATLAHFGHRVVLAEREQSRLSALRAGRMPIVEAGLDELVAGGVAAGNLSFTESAVEAVAGAEFVFLCVPTPQSADGSADLSYVEAAAKEIASHLRERGHRGQQVDRARGLGQHGRAGDRPGRHQRRLQPRVPPGGHGGASTASTRTGSSWVRTTRGRRPRWASCSRRPGRR